MIVMNASLGVGKTAFIMSELHGVNLTYKWGLTEQITITVTAYYSLHAHTLTLIYYMKCLVHTHKPTLHTYAYMHNQMLL